MKSVSFQLKYWLRLTYPVVASTFNMHATTALPNDFTSKNRVWTTSQ